MNATNDWIRPEDSQPEMFKTVLIAVNAPSDSGGRYQYVTLGTYINLRGKWMSFTAPLREDEYVTAWQPLPDPPEPDDLED